MEVEQLKRIADAIEEILRIVKKDMEPKNEKNKISKIKQLRYHSRVLIIVISPWSWRK